MQAKYLVGSLLLLCLLLAAWIPAQSDFLTILAFLVPANIAYLLLLHFAGREANIRYYLLLALFMRLAMLLGTPRLSDDFFRFVWDGLISQNGINPYEKTPQEFISSAVTTGDLYLYTHLNSPRFHTVYPPFLQFIFKLSAQISGNKLDIHLFTLKLCYALFSISMVFLLPYLLKLYGIKSGQALIYLLHPLVLLEELGNLHAEGIMVFFLALFLIAIKKLPQYAFLPFAASVAVKLTPLLLLPSVLYRWKLKKSLVFVFGIWVVLALVFLPYYQGILRGGFFNSLTLYFNQLEFNAYGYNLFKYFGYLTYGYNRIKILGPLAAACSIIIILSISLRKYRTDWQSFPLQALSLYFIYLFFSPIIHPWYLIPLIFLGTFRPMKFVIAWSFFAWLSYSHYCGGTNKEQYLLVGLEYVIVSVFLILDLASLWANRRKELA
jgi:hypothetical protein